MKPRQKRTCCGCTVTRCGRRLFDTAPFGHWNTTTVIAALRSTCLVAPMLLDDATNGRAFLTWVEQCLAPTLRPGDIVVADDRVAVR